MSDKVSVVGGGAWGTALAALLAEKGNDVRLWAMEPEVVDEINARHTNSAYLPHIALPNNLRATNDICTSSSGADYVVFVCPSHVLRELARRCASSVAKGAIIVNATKGMEIDSGKLPSQILKEELAQCDPDRFAFLSGPSFAREVAEHRPTGVVIAGTNAKIATRVQTLFRTPYLLTFSHDDIVGVQVGGAVKNVLAIAAGIVDGLKLGHNTRAALITRGLYEMMKIGKILGANPLTLVGLAGIGDLVLTCTGELSRNRSIGLALAEGKKLGDVLPSTRTVAEGVGTAKAIYQLIKKQKLTAPICTIVYQILYEDMQPRQALSELMSMELHEELGSLLKTSHLS